MNDQIRAENALKNNPDLALKVVKKVLLEKKIEELNNDLWDLKKEIKEMTNGEM
jgi:hypothetical protein